MFLEQLVLGFEITNRAIKKAKEHGVSICSYGNNGVHVYEGLEKLIKYTGQKATVTEREFDKTEYPYEWSIVFKGIKFYQISKSKEVLDV